MNKSATPNDISEWVNAPPSDTSAVPGYDDWLAQDIAAGLADLDAGNATPLADIRKDLGLE